MATRAELAAIRRQSKGLMGDFVFEDAHAYRANRQTFEVYVGADPSCPEPNVSAGETPEPGVEYRMADRFEMNLGILSGIDPNRPILVHLATAGGLWQDGMRMFGAILTCQNPITVVATKWARSMSSIIPLAADRFVMRPPTQYMFHRGSYVFSGIEEQAETEDRERRAMLEMMLRIYVSRLKEQGKYKKMSDQDIRTMLLRKMAGRIDVWLSTDEAVDWGFADGVFLGDHHNLRIKKKNVDRRQRMLDVLRQKFDVRVDVRVARR